MCQHPEQEIRRKPLLQIDLRQNTTSQVCHAIKNKLRDLAVNLFAGKTSVNGSKLEFVIFFTKSANSTQTKGR